MDTYEHVDIIIKIEDTIYRFVFMPTIVPFVINILLGFINSWDNHCVRALSLTGMPIILYLCTILNIRSECYKKWVSFIPVILAYILLVKDIYMTNKYNMSNDDYITMPASVIAFIISVINVIDIYEYNDKISRYVKKIIYNSFVYAM
jgi:hypothetical protein